MARALRRGGAVLTLAAFIVPAAAAQEEDCPALGDRLEVVFEAFTSMVETADLDGDGLVDLIGQRYGTSTVFPTRVLVALAKGPGRYGVATSYPIGKSKLLAQLRVADLDADGVLDVYTVGSSADEVSVLRGVGDGTLQQAVHYPGGTDLGAAVHADFDLDGDLDLAVTNGSALTFSLFENVGGAVFAAPAPFAVPHWSGILRAGLVDGDAFPDLLSGHQNTPFLGWLLHRGRGDGTFDPPLTLSIDWVNAHTAILDDVDGDGLVDLLKSGNGAFIEVYLGLGDGRFGPPLVQPVGGATSGGSLLGDLDADGLPDVVNVAGTTLTTLLGRGDGSFGSALVEGIVAPSVSTSFQVYRHLVDIDLDGHVDLLTVRQNDGTAWSRRGQGNGDLLLGRVWPAGGGNTELRALALGDLDADGWDDAVVTDEKADAVRVMRGAAGGRFLPGVQYATGSDPVDVAIADVDQDGRLDVVAANTGSDDVSWLRGLGDGTLAAAVQFPCGDHPADLVLTDLSGDGRPEAVIVQRFGGLLVVLRNAGPAGFGPPDAPLYVGHNPTDVDAGDIDADGWTDLVVLLQEGTQVVWLRNLGGGMLAAPQHHDLWTAEATLRVTDVNGDGLADALAASQGGPYTSGSSMFVLLGSPDGTLRPPTTLVTGSWGFGRVGALDADGVPELVVVDPAGRISVHPGLGVGQFDEPRHFAPAGRTHDAHLRDVDHDGQLDVVVLLGGARAVQVLRNVCGSAWTDEGHALPGASGFPQLDGTGTLRPGSTSWLSLSSAAPEAAVAAVLGASPALLPFKGGVLYPEPAIVQALTETDVSGGLALVGHLPDALLPGATVAVQCWIADASAPQGWSASNGLLGVAP